MKSNTDDAQLKRFVRAAPVYFKSGPLKTFEETRDAVHAVYCFSSGLSDSSDNVSIVENKIIEEDSVLDLSKLTTNDNLALSASQELQVLGQDCW